MSHPADIPTSPRRASGSQGGFVPPKPRRHRPDWLERPEIWVTLLILGVVVLAGGGTPVWARAMVLLVTGVWIVWMPPKETPSRLFEIALLFLLGLGLASSFMPAAWFGQVAWRDDLARLGLALPTTNATSPWLAGEAVAQLLAGLAWFYACWNLRLSHEARKLALWGLAGLTAALSAGAAYGNLLHEKYFLGTEAMNFSYFPNRNQSALWYCLGGLVAFGLMVDGLHRKRARLFIAAAMLTPCVLALVMGRSRMGLALFALGTVALVVVRLGRNSGAYLLRLVAPLGVLGLSLLVIFSDRDTLDRVPGLGNGANTSEFRLALWQDTVSLAKAQPAGVGLGQFAQVFPEYRYYSRTYQTVRHPDSDWVWLLGETGWAGLVVALVAVGALAKVFYGKRWSSCGPYRHMAAVCAGLFVLHSFVDVPAHRWGTWMLVAWLVGIAAPDSEDIPLVASWVPRWAWRAAGMILVVVGAAWLAAQLGAPTSAILVYERAQIRAEEASAKKDAAGAIAAAKQGMAVEPLQWRPYFQRASAELVLQKNPAAALNDFRLARFLEPTWARVPFAEGLLWQPTNRAQAFAAWREAAHREDATPEGLWRNMYDEMKLWPDGEDYGSVLSKTRPLFRWEFLTTQVSAKRFPVEWADELRRDPELAQYTLPQREDLLKRWAGLDGVAALAYLKEHPKAIADAWKIEASAFAATGHPREALDLARQHLTPLPVPELIYDGPADLDSVRTDFELHPKDLKAATTLVRLLQIGGDYAAAVAVLQKMATWPEPPLFVSWCLADDLARSGKMDEAWTALKPYLDAEEKRIEQKP